MGEYDTVRGPGKHGAQCGFTFVEVMIASLLLAVILSGFVAAYASVLPFANREVSLSSLQMKTSIAGDKVVNELSVARVDPPPADGTALTYQVPVDPDGDGQRVDGRGIIDWGMHVGGIDVAGASATVRYAVDSSLDEALLARDLNGDGDQVDLWDLGHLEKAYSDGTLQRLTGSWILQPTAGHGGDVDGDGTPDPVFTEIIVNGRSMVTVDLRTAWPVSARAWGQWHYRFHAILRNAPAP